MNELISSFELLPHPEGGWYKETYRSPLTVSHPVTGEPRSASTAIMFLITPSNVSRLHRITSDELWHFYRGTSLTIVELDEESRVMSRTVLGSDVSSGERLQHVVRAGTWFGCYGNDDKPRTATPGPDETYSFVGCTVSPGFDFKDFQLASRAVLWAHFAPEQGQESEVRRVIERLTEGLP